MCEGEGVSGARHEPVTSSHPRAWGITSKGLEPRGWPARLCYAQVPARDGCEGQGREVGKLQGAFWGGEQGGGGGGEVIRTAVYPPGALPRAVTNCTIEGAKYSACGPPCPRSCNDLVVSLGS